MRLKSEKRCKSEVQVDFQSMEFVAAGLGAGKRMRLDRTIRDLTCGDFEIPLVVIRLGVPGTELACLLELLWGRARRGGVV